jgi:hypothetical protein
MARALAVLLLTALPALAEPPRIESVSASKAPDGWRFDVTIRHPDTGWDHYADGWRVLGPDGAVLGTRTLLHPHETEQPFTRSLGGVVLPEGVGVVRIEARCSVDGWSTISDPVPLTE